MSIRIDAFAAWLQERESYYAEQALRLAGCVAFHDQMVEAAAKSRAFEEALNNLWKMDPTRPKPTKPWWRRLFT